VKLVRDGGVAVREAARDLDVHENVLRKWVRDAVADSQQAFAGHGRMKPQQLDAWRDGTSPLWHVLCIFSLLSTNIASRRLATE
jgi:Transposase